MAEKQGDLVKLVYEFNSARCCEVVLMVKIGLELQPVNSEVLMVKDEF